MFIPYGGFNGPIERVGLGGNVKTIFSPLRVLTKAGFDAVKAGTVSGLVQIRRTSDYSSQWFGVKGNGDIDYDEVYSFIGSNNGLIRDCLNEGVLNNSYTFKQLTTAQEPKLFNAGVLLSDGALFDGSNDVISALSASVSFLPGDFSIFAIVNTPQNTATKFFFARSDGVTAATSKGIVMYQGNSGADWTNGVWDGSHNITDTVGTVTKDVNTSLCMTFNSTSKTLTSYKDGSTTGNSSNASLTTAYDHDVTVKVGGESVVVNYFQGNIKCLVVFDKVLTSGEIANLHSLLI